MLLFRRECSQRTVPTNGFGGSAEIDVRVVTTMSGGQQCPAGDDVRCGDKRPAVDNVFMVKQDVETGNKKQKKMC